jgi:hypothetical protein
MYFQEKNTFLKNTLYFSQPYLKRKRKDWKQVQLQYISNIKI